MDVPNVLTGRLAVREQEIHALASEARGTKTRGRRLSNPEHLCPILRIELSEVRGMHTRDHQHVAAVDRLDIHQCHRASALVDDTRLPTSCDEPAEKAISFARHASIL